jgi:hypothetical protein
VTGDVSLSKPNGGDYPITNFFDLIARQMDFRDSFGLSDQSLRTFLRFRIGTSNMLSGSVRVFYGSE